MDENATVPAVPDGEHEAATSLTGGLFEPNAVQVTAKCAQFRRAGREFTRDAVTISLSELDEPAFNALYHEPMLAVTLVHIPQEN